MTWRLHQFPLCPFSRKVRLVLAEKNISAELALDYPWEQKDSFLALNPAGQTPVLVETSRNIALPDSAAIIEFLDEMFEESPLIGSAPRERAEVRRIAAWFDTKFYAEVGIPVMRERILNRLVHKAPPDPATLRQAIKTADQHLDYLSFLLDHRRWLAGNMFSLADIAAAAHLSVIDYLGGIDWRPHEQVKQWYSAIKSRPSFRPLLAERMPGISPPAHYDALDF